MPCRACDSVTIVDSDEEHVRILVPSPPLSKHTLNATLNAVELSFVELVIEGSLLVKGVPVRLFCFAVFETQIIVDAIMACVVALYCSAMLQSHCLIREAGLTVRASSGKCARYRVEVHRC